MTKTILAALFSLTLFQSAIFASRPRNPLPVTPGDVWQNDLDLYNNITNLSRNTRTITISSQSITCISSPAICVSLPSQVIDAQWGIKLTGTIGDGFRSDSSLELSRAYSGGNGVLMSIFDATIPSTTTSESAIAFGAYDSAGNKRKTCSLSTKWIDTNTSSGYSVFRINPTSSGGLTNETDIQVYGGHGIRFFEDANAVAPGANVATINGRLELPIQPTFLVLNSAGATDVTGDGTAYAFPWPTEILDQNSNFSSNSFVAPSTGPYRFSANVLAKGMSSTHTTIILALVTSNREYRSTYIFTSNPYTAMPIPINITADMDAGDSASITLTVSGGTKTVDIDNDAKQNYFSGALH